MDFVIVASITFEKSVVTGNGAELSAGTGGYLKILFAVLACRLHDNSYGRVCLDYRQIAGAVNS